MERDDDASVNVKQSPAEPVEGTDMLSHMQITRAAAQTHRVDLHRYATFSCRCTQLMRRLTTAVRDWAGR